MSRQDKRGWNFTLDEIDRLMNLCIRFRHIVNCKKTDKESAKLKDDTWNKIAIEYNDGLSSRFRDADTLKCKFRNLKGTRCGTYEKYKERMEADYGLPKPIMLPAPIKEAIPNKDNIGIIKQEVETDNDELNEFIENVVNEDPLDADEEQFEETETIIKALINSPESVQLDCESVSSDSTILTVQNSLKSKISNGVLSPDHSALKISFAQSLNTANLRQNPPTRKVSKHKGASLSSKWQEFIEQKILAVKEKCEQEKSLHDMNLKNTQMEFDLKMEIMREEFKFKRRKLELEILCLSKNLKNGANTSI